MSRRRPNRRATPQYGDTRDHLYPTLDLHGLSEADAISKSRRWLLDRQADFDLTVRIVTGKGLHSVGLPVLPAAIDGLLRQLRPQLVKEHDREPGGGAFLIRLRPPEARTTSRKAPTHDPALRREAEEALAELGIKATPELIDAEIRRLLLDRGQQNETV